jgi:hypothetical protein
MASARGFCAAKFGGRTVALGLRQRRAADRRNVQIPAKNASGRLSSSANHTGRWDPSASASFSEKLVKDTSRRIWTTSGALRAMGAE